MPSKKPKPAAKRAPKKTTNKQLIAPTTIERFAHPFYDLTPAGSSSPQPADAAAIAAFSAAKLEAIPAPKRNPPEMTLSDVIGAAGAAAIASSGKITFHAFGDSGNPQSANEEMVSDAMTAEYDTTNAAASPAFLLHLGDVIYYDNTDSGYHEQFYAPYKRYPGKIIAIPGNHDGELFKFDGSSTGQKTTLGAFQDNFCLPTASVPPAAGTIYRQMVSQPGVYWRLAAPFVDVIGLYSNVGETSGFISSPQIGTAQKDWLVRTISGIAKARASGPRKAFVLAVHHPPYSNGGHEPSVGML
ncbi:MAG: metallophosphoesterase, partial [Gemmatimonadaceae bacterium]